MEKDFDEWNKEKKKLHQIGHEHLRFHEREIWWCSLGVNLGGEQDGKNHMFERPVLVFKKFNDSLAWVLPMSTKRKYGPFYQNVTYNNIDYIIILSQLRLVSVKRFRRYIRKLSYDEFALTIKYIRGLVGL